MKPRFVVVLWLLWSIVLPSMAFVWADEPPAPVVVEEPAQPIEGESAEITEPPATNEESPSDADKSAGSTEAPADKANAGLDDLDKATQLKVTAESLPDLNDVVDRIDSAIEKGLDQQNEEFANQLLISALLQRATVLSGAVLDRPPTDPRRDPRWMQVMQVRQFAINDLQRLLMLDRDIAEAHLLLGRLQALPPGDPKTARRELTFVINSQEAPPDDRAQAYALRGTLQEDDQKRAADFDAAVELMPQKPDYYRIRAQYRFAQEKLDEALADVDKALELDADHAATIELRGLILLGLKRYDEALAEFNKASALAPQSMLPHQHLGEVYRQQGNLQKSVEQLSKALELAPDDVATLLLRANVQIQLKDNEAALKDVDAAIKAQPQLLVAHLLRAEILAASNRTDEAIAGLEKLVPLAPNQPRLLEPLATFYLVAERPHKAIEAFSKVIELEPDNFRALRFRGDARLSIGEHADAVADFDAALKLDADDEGLLNNFAWVLATSPEDKVRDGKRAVELATKAAELSSYTVPHILSTLAAAYAETDDFESAKKWSKQAVERSQQELDAAPEGAEHDRLESVHKDLEKELASYEAGKPVREIQHAEDKEPAATKDAAPPASDHTSAPGQDEEESNL